MTLWDEHALTAFILGDLEEKEAQAIRRALQTNPDLRGEVLALGEALSALPLGLEPAASPQTTVRQRLIESVAAEARFTLARPLARLCDVTTSTARGFIEAIDQWHGWDVLMPGVRFLDVDGGPALAGARPGLVYLEPGVRFPRHVHRGQETSLFLQGTAKFDDGRTHGPGDILVMANGSLHAFEVTSAEPMVFAVVLGDIEMVDPVD